jgi:hypothetical protein
MTIWGCASRIRAPIEAGLPEVERGAVDRRQLAGRRERGVDLDEAAGGDAEPVAEHVAAALAGEVEVGVLGRVEDRRRVGRRRVVDPQRLAGQGVGDGDVEGAGVAFLAVRAAVGEADGGAVAARRLRGRPDALVEPRVPAVEVVRPVVAGELVGAAVEGEAASVMRLAKRPARAPKKGSFPAT